MRGFKGRLDKFAMTAAIVFERGLRRVHFAVST